MNYQRAKIIARGAVQGVGFRPFVYHLATELGLNGWIVNSGPGVFIEVEGQKQQLDEFLLRLGKEKPPRAILQSLEFTLLDAVGFRGFEIRRSDPSGEKSAFILPDIAICEDCLGELFDPKNRRYLHPFITCTQCGPRFTIFEGFPYDRPNTSMKKFTMCSECEQQYRDPRNRRFHAQPIACPACGPRVELWDPAGDPLAKNHEAVLRAAEIVRAGEVLALKGIGGFQLMVDATNEQAVQRLRERKHREEKPFALIYPSVELARTDCQVSKLEGRLLHSPEAPIVLLEREASLQKGGRIAAAVAPGNPCLGVMLPYSPLHHLLLRELGFPIVATSGNLTDEPICTDEREALERLHGIADAFLVHDRPIVRPMDDSVVRVMLGRELLLRRARGYAPLPVHLKEPVRPTLALGAHLKNTVAFGVGNEIFISQHIGDLETREAYAAFSRVAADLPALFDLSPESIACDLHPDYLSTKHAQTIGKPVVPVQHHYAHIAACMAENELEGPLLGVAWDGTGLGTDGTIWGGEFLLIGETSFDRLAHLRQFRLPGGDASIRQPRRTALGLLFEVFGERTFQLSKLSSLRNFSSRELATVEQMLQKSVNAPVTSSAGRLFDAVASIIGLRQEVTFEGQAAMELEFAIEPNIIESYPFEVRDGLPWVVDWEPMLHQILKDVQRGLVSGVIAAKFHNALSELIVSVARKAGEGRVILSGGCFQNRYLTERTVRRLEQDGFRPYWHQRVPPNDGGIALGQVMAALRTTRSPVAEEEVCIS